MKKAGIAVAVSATALLALTPLAFAGNGTPAPTCATGSIEQAGGLGRAGDGNAVNVELPTVNGKQIVAPMEMPEREDCPGAEGE